jgi:hypothetical protein
VVKEVRAPGQRVGAGLGPTQAALVVAVVETDERGEEGNAASGASRAVKR